MKNQFWKLTVIVSALALTSCGASKVSNGAITVGNSTLSSSTMNPTTNCSHDVSNQANLSTRLMEYSDVNGTRGDLIRMKFDRFPADFSASDSSAIELWTRSVDSNGNWGAWQQVSFYLEQYSAAGVKRSSYIYNDITWGQLKAFASTYGITYTTAADLFGQVTLLAQLRDVGSSKILTAKLYESSASPEVSALIPAFEANPVEYQKDHPSALYAYHPLGYLAGSTTSDAQYVSDASSFCF